MGLVCLRSYFDPEEAYVACSALQASGIYAVVLNDGLNTSLPHLRIATGGYRLSAPSQQESEAREALEEIESRRPDEPICADAPCAKCGGQIFRRQRSWRWALIGLLYNIGFAAHDRRVRCIACGAVIDNDDRHFAVRFFFLLVSVALILWAAWDWRRRFDYFLGG